MVRLYIPRPAIRIAVHARFSAQARENLDAINPSACSNVKSKKDLTTTSVLRNLLDRRQLAKNHPEKKLTENKLVTTRLSTTFTEELASSVLVQEFQTVQRSAVVYSDTCQKLGLYECRFQEYLLRLAILHMREAQFPTLKPSLPVR